MPLHISNPEADRSAHELAKITGETIAEAVVEALRERLVRETAKAPVDLKAEIMAISQRAGRIPQRTGRAAEEIVGYDERGADAALSVAGGLREWTRGLCPTTPVPPHVRTMRFRRIGWSRVNFPSRRSAFASKAARSPASRTATLVRRRASTAIMRSRKASKSTQRTSVR